jgi:hypothetical protein
MSQEGAETMKLKYKPLLCCFITVSLVSCSSVQYQRSPSPGFGIERVIPEKKIDKTEEDFFMTVSWGTVEELESFLKAGHNPNRMKYPGSIPWRDSNPLWYTSTRYDMAEVLIRYGADVTRRPYIFHAVYHTIISERYPDERLLAEGYELTEKMAYDMVKMLLDAGADPNFMGGSYRVLLIATDANYKKYWKERGWLPINMAIRENVFSVVDLLLEHGAVLDEKSLDFARQATERSGSTEMEDYIRGVWERQQSGKDDK